MKPIKKRPSILKMNFNFNFNIENSPTLLNASMRYPATV